MLKSEDKLKIEIFQVMTPSLHASFQMLYQPLIGHDAAILYEVLCAVATMHAKIKNHRILPELTGLSIEVIEKSRLELEKFLLMKTFYNGIDNIYIYQMMMPKNGNEFLSHDVFGRLYLNKMGDNVFKFNKITFANNFDNKESFLDITTPFENILIDWNDKLEEHYDKIKPDELINVDIPINFNMDLFLSSTSVILFPANERNKENLKLIGELGTSYGISIDDMRKIVAQSMNLKIGKLDKNKLKQKAKTKKMVFIPSQKPDYLLPPVQFLQLKQHGVEVSKWDENLIDSLLKKYKLKPDVVNALIEYVLKINNQSLNKGFVESKAAEWVRLNIDTYDKALKHIKQDKRKTRKDKMLPDWVIEEEPEKQKSEVEKVDKETLQKELEELRKNRWKK